MEYLSRLLAFYHAHEAWLNVLIWPLISGVLGVLFKKKSPEEWERWAMSKPLGAFCLELLRAVGLDPTKIAVAFERYAARKAQRFPDDLFDRLPLAPTLKEALKDPKLRELIEQMVQTGGHLTPPSTSPPASTPSAPAPPPAA